MTNTTPTAPLAHPGGRWGPAQPADTSGYGQILSPEPGYEQIPDDGDPEKLPRDAQRVDGEWWAPRYGCDSLAKVLESVRRPELADEAVEILSSTLNSSSEHRQQGLLSPAQRSEYLRIIFFYMNDKEALAEETSSMQDLCYHLYSESVAERMATHLSVSVPELRKALDIGLKAATDCEGAPR